MYCSKPITFAPMTSHYAAGQSLARPLMRGLIIRDPHRRLSGPVPHLINGAMGLGIP